MSSSQDVLQDFDFDSFLHQDSDFTSTPSQVKRTTVHSTISKDHSKGAYTEVESNFVALAKRSGNLTLKSRVPLPAVQAIASDAKEGVTGKDTLDFGRDEALDGRLLGSFDNDATTPDRTNISLFAEHPQPEGGTGGKKKRGVRRKKIQARESMGEQMIEREQPVPSFASDRPLKRTRVEETGPDAQGPSTRPGNSANATSTGAEMAPPQAIRMIYTVECFEVDPVGNGFHDALFFEDPPRRCGEQNRHLEGNLAIEDLNQFVSTCEGDGFVVLRRYVCEDSYNNQLARTLASRNYAQSQVTESLLIVSNILQREIESVSLYSPYEETDHVKYAQRRCVMKAPYKWLYHHRARLNSVIQTRGDRTAGQIRNLLGHIQANHGPFYTEIDVSLSNGRIRTNMLEWMYQPNEMILYVEKGIETVYVLRKWPHIAYDGNLKLDCWNWAYDGFWLQRKSTTITLTIPPGIVTVATLPALPVRFTTIEQQQKLIDRGKGFWKRRYKTLAAYSGWDFRSEQYYDDSETRCIIDYRTYQKFHPSTDSSFEPQPLPFDIWPKTIAHDESLSNQNFALLPPEIQGFILKEKKWTSLLVENVREVTWNKTAFDRLVLPRPTKDLIKALISVRKSAKRSEEAQNSTRKTDDLMAGKGNGLIMLFHGGPGTGKTLTAESVSEIAEKPLYRVTCGEIGTTADAVEQYLETILHLGKTWDCVLLLDEADVFLEERTLSDLERNSLVSVFLRILEYYEGILILTSNRVGTFDEAFQSRIQVALYYPPLDQTARKKIWENFFDLKRQDEDADDVNLNEIRRRLDELADLDINGRQIRNAWKTARDLAEYRKEPLDWEHLELAIKPVRDFKKYLKNVHGHTDEQRAREEKLR